MLSPRSLPPRYFTPQEANELVPRVRAYLLALRKHGRALRDIDRALDAAVAADARAELERARAEHELGQAHLLERIAALGAELVDPLEMGRVRFPAMRNGEPVWLFWSLGEPKVKTWAPIGARVFGSRPVRGDPGARWEWKN